MMPDFDPLLPLRRDQHADDTIHWQLATNLWISCQNVHAVLWETGQAYKYEEELWIVVQTY